MIEQFILNRTVSIHIVSILFHLISFIFTLVYFISDLLIIFVNILDDKLRYAGAKPGTRSSERGGGGKSTNTQWTSVVDYGPNLQMNSNHKSRPSLPGGLIATTHGSGKTSLTAEGAKNPRAQTSCLKNLNIGTHNVRTLRDDGKLEELLSELKNIKWDIIGLRNPTKRREATGHQIWSSTILSWYNRRQKQRC